MSPLFEHNSKQSYWLNKNTFSSYLSPKRIAFIQRLIYIVDQQISLINIKSASICDVSFGSGYLLYHLNKMNSDLTLSGTELNEDAITVLKHLVPSVASCYHQNIYDLSIPKQDIIFCTEVLEHLSKPEIAIQNLLQSITQKGFVIITVPNGREDVSAAGKHSEDSSFWSGHINFWSPESWKLFIEKEFPDINYYFFTVPDYGYSKNGVILSRRNI